MIEVRSRSVGQSISGYCDWLKGLHAEELAMCLASMASGSMDKIH